MNSYFGVACLCEGGTNRELGRCAWTGDFTYDVADYIRILK